MEKKFKKLLAAALSLIMLFSFCAVPMTANAQAPANETYETPTEIGFTDLKNNSGKKLSGTEQMGVGDKVLTYDSETFSTVLKFRWKAASDKTTVGFGISFDNEKNGNGDASLSYPFGFDIVGSSSGVDIDKIRFQPGGSVEKKLDAPIMKNSLHDIEFGRLKVLTGENAGKYYFYLKFDGELIGETYVAVDSENKYTYTKSGSSRTVTMENKILIGTWGRGGSDIITASPVGETYYDHDVITMSDLTRVDGVGTGGYDAQTGSIAGVSVFTYENTVDTYSAVLRYSWTPGLDGAFLQNSFERNGNNLVHPFGVWVKNSTDAGPNGAWHYQANVDSNKVAMTSPITANTTYTIELGRLKVKTGKNADKYYGYLKVNGNLLQDAYVTVDADGHYKSNAVDCYLGNQILFYTAGSTNSKLTDATIAETYYDYDEITYDDLLLDGQALSGDEQSLNGGAKVFTFDRTSPTYSAVFKFRWIPGVDGAETQFSFEHKPDKTNMAYPFGTWIKPPSGDNPNGAWHLQPNDGSKLVQMSETVKAGTAYDMELGRLKVKTGSNKGQYYTYLNINGKKIRDAYVTVDADGHYKSNSVDCYLGNEIYFYSGDKNNCKITAIKDSEPEVDPDPEPDPEPDPNPDSPYYAYDEITYDDLLLDGQPLSGDEFSLNGGAKVFTFDRTSPTYSAVFKFRWIPGVDGAETQFSFEHKPDKTNMAYPFGTWIKPPSDENLNGAWHLQPNDGSKLVQMAETVKAGTAYDIELGRLKVKNGDKAGQYYTYLNINGEKIKDAYVTVDSDGHYKSNSVDCYLGNEIYFYSGDKNNCKITATPVPEEYEEHDEIGYEDLIDANGNPLPDSEWGVTTSVVTYNKTSATGSAVLKFRWKEANAASNFQLGFDTLEGPKMGYMFGFQYYKPDTASNIPNGKIWLRPSYGPEVVFDTAFVTGESYNIEFARLKVKTGKNAGKYYVYLKINDELVAKDYVAADVVGADGNYITRPTWEAPAQSAISNEIFFSFWDGGAQKIAPYKEKQAAVEHEGVRGDFDNDGVINATDLTLIKKILLGVLDISEMPEGIADFNRNGNVDILDLISLKKYLAPVNTYAKSGNLVLGTQEHLLEQGDTTKTAEYIADASAALGATAYRLSEPIHNLYYATSNNGVAVKEDNMNNFKGMVEALKEKGITEILYVTDSFILPYGYSTSKISHNKTVPHPIDDAENYVAWLTVNAAAFKALAQEFPEIKFFEPYNEINVSKGSRLEKAGIGWNASETEQAKYKYSIQERAGIMADLCWYVSEAVKSADPANQVTTPSISVSTNAIVENNFLDELYKAIESGAYPTNKAVADKRVDNYFTIINIHSYADFKDSSSPDVSDFVAMINNLYNVAKKHNDGGSRVWLTETGYTDIEGDRDLDMVALNMKAVLNAINNQLTFIDSIFMYKIANASVDANLSVNEVHFGLFYAGDDYDNPYQAKPIAKTVYTFFNNGSTDYSAIDAFVSKYAG